VLDVTIRADATPTTGAGHVMRMTTFGTSWQRAGLGPVRLVGDVSIPHVAAYLGSAALPVTPAWGSGEPGALLVVDHYDRLVREDGAGRDYRYRVLVDDAGARVPDGFDLVWNPNVYGPSARYEFGGPVLTGAGHVPIREGLPRWSGRAADTIAVALGSAVATTVVRDALLLLEQGLPAVEWWIAAAWMPPRWHAVDPGRPWDDLIRSGRLVTGAGITMWEAAATGIPAVVVTLAPNQVLGAAWARAQGVPTVSAYDATSPERLAAELSRALEEARPLPSVTDGSFATCRELAALAASRRVA
jgi:spore coat polysaccharide biosynthesis predicted glycosyltransferase SpsG